jgi:hypothetical protein
MSACWLAEGGRRLPVLDTAPAVPRPTAAAASDEATAQA